jgi:K+-sensing histidine kinase KdpD
VHRDEGNLMPFGSEGKLWKLPWPSPRLAQASVALGAGDTPPDNASPWRRQFLTNTLPLAKSLLLVGAATIGLLLVSPLSPANLAPVVYLIPVMVAAARWGTWPAIIAAIASAASSDFFFYPPFYSFRLDDSHSAINLLLFLLVALISGDLTSRLRRETETLRRREDELQYLYKFSRRLASCHTVTDLAGAIQDYLSETFGRHTAFFFPASATSSHPAIADAAPAIIRDNAASMMKPGSARARVIKDEAGKSLWLLRAVVSEEATHGVIAVDIGGEPRAAAGKRTSRIETILAEASQTLQRLDIGGAMEQASHRSKDQLLRDAFHGDLSHELRSPLAAIRGSASVLEAMPSIKDENRAFPLVSTITDEAERLDCFIGNLLNATRVSASDIRPHLSCADPRDVINAAIRRRSRQLAAHDVNVSFEDNLPMVNVDSPLAEEACGQLLENAAKYSPPGSAISVAVSAERGRVTLSISDHGAGITAEERAQLGRRSFRGTRHREAVPGAGLGFWIASTFVKANNGSIDIVSGGEGCGTMASIILPEAMIDEDAVSSNDE